MSSFDRKPPQDIAAEQAVLGAMMLSPADIKDVSEILTSADFYKPGHSTIYDTILSLADKGEPTDSYNVTRVLVDTGQISKSGGADYLHELVASLLCLAGDGGYYARIIADKAQLRGLAEAGTRMIQQAHGGGAAAGREPHEIVDLIRTEVNDLAVRKKRGSRRTVDLTPFLDGTYKAPMPSIGGLREDHKHMIYPGKWHTIVAPNTAGKTFFALYHAVAEMRRGNTVSYGHFEEASPAGTIERLLLLGCSVEMILAHFQWVDCTTSWKPGELAAEVREETTLVILDGIIAACGQHGWNPLDTTGEGEYRKNFVTPLTARGAAVVGLGHPVKNLDRQWERHGLGTTAWLDNVDGVGFRLMPSRNPIRAKHYGSSALYSVKDRNAKVEEHGRPEERHPGWVYLGQFVIDSSPGQIPTASYVTVPQDRDGPGDSGERVVGSSPPKLEEAIAQIRRYLEMRTEPTSYRLIQSECDVAKATTREALDWLIDDGQVVVTKGPRNSQLHMWIDSETTVPHCPRLSPGDAGQSLPRLSPTVPTPFRGGQSSGTVRAVPLG